VEPLLIENRLLVLAQNQIIRIKKQQEQKEYQTAIRSKSFDEYDWVPLIDSGEINRLQVLELNKYLRHYGLGLGGRKEEKLRKITAHHLKSHAPTPSILELADMLVEGNEPEPELGHDQMDV